jgi:hypothetical protein
VEAQIAIDAWMSEWGNPPRINTWVLYDEYIVIQGETRGTETSKYPQEKKTKVIPQVVASESGRAQTNLEVRD